MEDYPRIPLTRTAKMGNPKGSEPGPPCNVVMRHRTHREIDHLIDLAEAREQYGRVTVDIDFEAGTIRSIGSHISETIKRATT